MFDYYNRNPLGIEEEDCVTRAISYCANWSYFKTRKKLQLTAELLECEELCPCCYFHLLDYVLKFDRVKCRGMTVGEFAKQHPKGTYLIRMTGHISVIKDGRIKDLFDCSSYVATDCWRTD